jgi:hypothetical protein
MGVDIETDEFSFFPFLYWPVTADMAIPSREAYEKLNRYVATGGMILFGTRDADMGGFFISYSPKNRAGSKFVDLTIISRDGKFLR